MNLTVFYLYLYFIFTSKKFGSSENISCVLVKPIIELKPYQMTLFIKNSENFEKNYFIENLVSNIPAVIVDMEKSFENRSLVTSFPRKSSLIVIQQETLNFEEIQSTLEKVIELKPTKMRPKSLVVFDDNFSDNLTGSILRYGWSKKFLDMTILNVKTGETLSFNPFSNEINSYCAAVSIFPDKLRNLMKYPLRIFFYDAPPWLFKYEIDNFTEYVGMEVDYLKLFESALNFKMDFSQMTPEHVDFIPGRHPLTVKPFDMKVKLETGRVVSFLEICAVIPEKKSHQSELSISKLLIKLLVVALVFLLIFLLHCILIALNIDSEMFEYISMLLSQPRVRELKTFVPKILLILLGLFSMLFFPDIVAELTNVFVYKEEKPISSYKDVLDADLKPYGESKNFKSRDTDDHLQDILPKIIDTYSINYCLEMAVKQKSVMCITSIAKARLYVKRFKKLNGSPLLKIASIDFPSVPESFVFPPGSPYVEAFDEVTQKLFATGLIKKLYDFYLDAPIESYDDEFKDEENQAIFKQSFVVCFFGFFVSAIAFICEFLKKSKRY